MIRVLFVFFLSFHSFVSFGGEELPINVQSELKRHTDLEYEYWIKQDWEKHMRVCHELLVKFESYLSKEEKSRWNTKLGNSFIMLGSYHLAIERFTRAIQFGEGKEVVFAYSQLGFAYMKIGDYTRSKQAYQSSVDLTELNSERIPHLNSLGYIHFLNGEYDKAYRIYQDGLRLFKTSEVDSIQLFILHSNLGSLFLSLGEFEKGLKYLKSTENKVFFERDPWFAREIYTKLSRHYLNTGNCDLVAHNMSQLMRYVDSNSVDAEFEDYLRLRLEQSILCKDLKLADQYYRRYEQVKNELKTKSLETLRIIEQLQQADLKNQLNLVSDNLVLKQRSESRYILILIILGFLILATIASLLILRKSVKNKQKRKENYLELREELITNKENSNRLKSEMREKELRNKKLELMHILQSKNNDLSLLYEVQHRIDELKNAPNDVEIQKGINQLSNFLKSHAKVHALNEVIDENIDLIGGDFKLRIQSNYPELSDSDLQLVLLMRIGLSNKEIALLRNIEVSSVRIFKHRVKQKMALEKEIDFNDFVRTL